MTMLFKCILVLITLLVAPFLASLITPFNGIVVRTRANFSPKFVQLCAADDTKAGNKPDVTSFVGMWKRVVRIEGWAGLYKGFTQALLGCLFSVAIAMLTGLEAAPQNTQANRVLVNLLATLVLVIVDLPSLVILYRTITTPYKLSLFRPLYSLRLLMTRTERRKPWTLYFTPGLFAARVLYHAYSMVRNDIVRSYIARSTEGQYEKLSWTSVWVGSIHPVNAVLLLAIAAFSTSIICPLEVISCKMALQKNNGASDYNSLVTRERKDERDQISIEEATAYTDGRDVVCLREEYEPYHGLIDCVKKVVAEEGWQSLYRLWWLTAFRMVTGIF